MMQFPRAMIASSIALAIGLSGCGGGGSDVASTPPPPPTPTPTPTPAAATISALARAVAPNANLFPAASVGGPTIQSHSSTVFPLLESVVSIVPGRVSAASTTMTAGATLASVSPSSSYGLDVGNPALGVSNVVLSPSSSGSANVFVADLGGGALASLDIANAATSNLSWTTYGFWNVQASNNYTNAAFVTGYSTPATSVPANGSATYRGNVIGEAYHPAVDGIDGVTFYHLSGDVTLEASFGSGSITGNLTNMITTGFEGDTAPWNSVSLLGTISGAKFNGTSAATNAPGNSGSLSNSATGTFAGMFFGPSAEELGAVWTLNEGTSSAVGSFGATSSSSSGGAGYWDY